MGLNSFGARSTLELPGRTFEIYRLDALDGRFDVARLPFSLKILLENLLRQEDGVAVQAADVEGLAGWDPAAEPDREIAFAPARILMQDFTGVPALTDLAAMADAMADMGGDPATVDPLVPADLVIDHSIVADVSGVPEAFARNGELEFSRNRERYEFLRWGQEAFAGLRVVPPNTGICHQVNLEYLASVVFTDGAGRAFPDTLVGTDSHTPMVNGLGVLGWGVGGIEAEAAMLGQPISMLVPRVVGFKLSGELPEGSTATDLVLTVTELLRRHGVVGKFVEFYGPGVARVPVENRATIGNMSPEYGSTCAIFPIDGGTLRYLRFTGRPPELVDLVERYAKEQGLWHHEDAAEPGYSETLELDLGGVVPSLAGPKRPQDRVPLDRAKVMFAAALAESLPEAPPATGGGGGPPGGTPARPQRRVPARLGDGREVELDHGHVVIAAITSCTNTSNPSVMLTAGLLARKAVQRGLEAKPWVKTTLAPGSKVVIDYYSRAGLLSYLEKLGFNLVGFGCTTCIGNSGPLLPGVGEAVDDAGLAVCSVLSGNRNFEGRIHPQVRMNYLASPPLVVAYALAGTMDVDLTSEPLGFDPDGRPVHLRDVWPSEEELAETLADAVRSDLFATAYADIFAGGERWQAIQVPPGSRFEWDPASTYIRRPPFFDGMPAEPAVPADLAGARVLAVLGDSVTTDHISPAGVIRRDSPAGRWLQEEGVAPEDFSSYGSRRGNYEVMVRGTFASPRIRNRLVPGVEGGVTLHLPSGEQLPIYEAAVRYRAEGVPLVVLAGKDYGSGSSRDWAAKGTALLGVRAVLAESFERIHRSNLIGMGILPLQFRPGESVEALGLSGHEELDIGGVAPAIGRGELPGEVEVQAGRRSFRVRVRIDTLTEALYYRHGGILQYVLRRLRG